MITKQFCFQICFVLLFFGCAAPDQPVDEPEVQIELSDTALLKQRALQFIADVGHADTSQSAYTSKIKPFFDPDYNNLDSLCEAYYEHWNTSLLNGFHAENEIIESITFLDDGQKAHVVISNDWVDANGESTRYNVLSIWVKKNNNWFRTADEAVFL